MVRLLFELEPAAELTLHAEARTNALRGAFGATLRQMMCSSDCTQDTSCPHRANCVYAMLFEPSWPNEAEGFRTGEAPRAFLFRSEQGTSTHFGPRRPLRFELRLFGQVVEAAQIFISAFQQLSRTGFAGQPAALRSVRSLDWVGQSCSNLLVDGTVTREKPVVLKLAELRLPEISRIDTLILHFLTPVRLNDRETHDRMPSFGALIRRLRDRLSALCRVHEQKAWEADFAAIGQMADAVTIRRRNAAPSKFWRYSSHQNQHVVLQGFKGRVEYQDVPPELMPLLRIGEEIHVGRHTVWGYGQYRCISA